LKKRLRSPGDIVQELKLLENSLERILQSFQLQKDSALGGDPQMLETLRERARTHYSPELGKMRSDLRQLRYRSSMVEGVPSAIFRRLDELETRLKEARAHVTGAVNRLMRNQIMSAGDETCTE